MKENTAFIFLHEQRATALVESGSGAAKAFVTDS